MDSPYALTLLGPELNLKTPCKAEKLSAPEGWLSGRKRWS